MITFKDFLDAVADAYNDEDPSSPSILVARVTRSDGTNFYYASVVRYGESFGRGKKVVCKSDAETPDLAVNNLYVIWKSIYESEKR